MHKLRKMLCILLCFSMMFSCVQTVYAEESEGTKEYDIYPIVRDIDYDGTEFTMSSKVNVIYEEGIDEYTKAYLEEVLTENGVSYTEKSNAVSGKWNILLGINGSGEAADAYEDSLTLETADLYEQYDGYLLEAKDQQITIVGKDSDAVYFGVATLKMMLSSFGDRQLAGAQIEDYAGMEYRGYIEGFYGSWSHENRKSLMTFAKDMKMNMYVYAAKGDSYHTSNWAEEYPKEQIEEFKELVELGKQTKCEFVWSVHLGNFFKAIAENSYEESYYEAQYKLLMAKLTQLYNIGVKKFDVLNDDFGGGSNEFVVTVLNRLNSDLTEMGCDPITYCPQGYNKSWAGTACTELIALQQLDESIAIYWTGDDVNWPITQETVDYVKEKTGHEACFWLNYPVNEHAGSGMFLGDITYYARDGVTGLRGAVSNPSRYAQTTKVALFQLASLFWNNSDYSEHAEEIWLDSFDYIEPEVAESYRTIARNTSNCPNSSRITAGFPESEYIKENLEEVLSKIESGESVKGTDADILLAEFANILNSIEVFENECDNAALISELEPWLNSLTDVATACYSSLKAAIALENEDISTAWSEFAAASKALDGWDNYTNEADKSALAGSKRLQPFASKMVTYVKGTLAPLLDSNYTDFTPTLYAKLGGEVKSHDSNADLIFDGDTTTYAQWNTVQKQDDYFGVDLGRVMEVTDITILQANSDTHHDYFHKAVLEYSEDGVTFIQIGEQYNDTVSIAVDGLSIQARYVRLRLVETGTASKPDYWTHVREFTVNKEIPEENRIYTNVEAYAKQPLTIMGPEWGITDLENVTLESGEYIGIKFVNLSSISSFTNETTGAEDLTLEISDNGTVWTEITDLSQAQVLKYVRLINKTDAAISFDMERLSVVVENTKAEPKFLETNLTNGLQEGSWANVFDGELSTYAWTNEAQAVGDYIVFDLGSVISLYDVSIVLPDGNPRLYNAEIQISTDKTNWETIATVENDNSVFEVPYRYVNANANGANAKYLRIYITGSTGYYLKLQEIIINSTVGSAEGTDEIAATFGNHVKNAIDGDLSTLFSGTASAGDYVEYKFTESTNYNAISILQDPNSVDSRNVKRLYGADRYATSFAVANEYKKVIDVKEFDTVIVTTGKKAADALSGSYFAAQKKAPILLTDQGQETALVEYVKENLTAGGQIYILGGTGAVSAELEGNLKNLGYEVDRLKGTNRYGTNIEILNEAGITGNEILVATGEKEYDSLSASAVNKPILLVNKEITDDQKGILEKLPEDSMIYILGGTGAVSADIEAALRDYGTVERVKGKDRYETSVEIAKKFLGENVKKVTLAYGEKFPDGLCGGPLAAELHIPVLLVKKGGTQYAAEYADGVRSGYVLGGTGVIEEEVVNEIFKETNSSPIVVKVLTDTGYKTIGYLNESAQTFKLDAKENVYALRIEFEEETDISIYEIYLDAVLNTDDIGEYVEPIIKEEEVPDVDNTEPSNIALGKTVTVSGTSDGNKDYVNDGVTSSSSKWDSDAIKSGTTDIADSWIYIDLGENKTSIFNQTEISYFNKIYPTIMQIQISNDGENWIMVKELTRDHNGETYPVVTETYEPALTARYVRLYFEELNSAAAGNGVGIMEWEITGVSLSNVSVKKVQTFETANAALGTAADALGLPAFVAVTLTHEIAGDYEVQVPVSWNIDTYDGSAAGSYVIEGTLDLPETVGNTENIKAVWNVVVE